MSEPTMSPPAAPAASGTPGGMELATYGQRFLAFLIDFGVMIVIGIVFGILSYVATKALGTMGALVIGLLQLLINIAYYPYLWGVDNPITGRGQSIGKMVMGIKIINEDGSDIALGGAVLRWLGYIVSYLVIFLGYVWIFIDDNNQGWHDKIAKTYVVKA